MAEEILASVQVRRDNKANWEAVNPVLLNGEAAYEKDTDMFKIGDGVNNYKNLPYHNKVGPKGDTGATPQISMNVSTGNPGTSASVSVTGTAENPVINLTVPRGDTGKTGSTGPKGDTGSSGVYIGTSQPTDSNINVWIDSDGEPTEVIDDFAREEIGRLKSEIPTALPNPQPLTINGQSYDGSDAVTVTTVEIDDTLTQSGKAADAKAVGDQLSALNEANAKLKNDVAAITPDDTEVDGKPWTSKKTVDSLCMPIDATGNPVQVYPVEGYPLGVKVSWEPTQAGGGDPSPVNIRPITGRGSVMVIRCWKNLWSAGDVGVKQYKEISANYPAGEYVLSFEAETEATSNTVQIGWCVDGEWKYAQKAKDSRQNIHISASIGITGFRFYAGDGPSYNVNATYKNIQFEFGSTATAYEAYIGSTTDIALPETVYGGTLDMETGVVTVEYGHIASYAGEPLPGDWISDRDVYAPDATPTIGAQVVYKLANPYTIQLTEHQIAALSGVNTIYTDAGSVVVTGAEDPRHTIVTLTDRIAALESAAAGV